MCGSYDGAVLLALWPPSTSFVRMREAALSAWNFLPRVLIGWLDFN